VLSGAAGMRWASWVWLTLVALANLHRVHDRPVALAAIVVTGVVTVLTTLSLREANWTPTLRTGQVGLELVAAAAVVAADGWVEQGRLTGQTLAGSWPVPTILVAALAGGIAGGAGAGILLAAARSVAVAVSGWAPGQAGRAWLAVVSTSIEWIAVGVASAVVIRLLRQAQSQVAEAQVRERIARDLHDGVLQTLTLIERRSPSPEIARIAREQERDLRAYLSGDYDREGTLGGALRAAAARHEKSWPATVITVSASEDASELCGERDARADAVREALVGAVTEALTNSSKHGQASRTVVFADLDERTDCIFVSVKDDGLGFDPAAFQDPRAAGTGLQGSIRGRIERVGGTVELVSKPGEGTEVLIRVPSPGRPRSGLKGRLHSRLAGRLR
jgi:signal transduction histidine kinase